MKQTYPVQVNQRRKVPNYQRNAQKQTMKILQKQKNKLKKLLKTFYLTKLKRKPRRSIKSLQHLILKMTIQKEKKITTQRKKKMDSIVMILAKKEKQINHLAKESQMIQILMTKLVKRVKKRIQLMLKLVAVLINKLILLNQEQDSRIQQTLKQTRILKLLKKKKMQKMNL